MIRVLNTEVERKTKIKTNLVYFIYSITTHLFRMQAKPGYECGRLCLAYETNYIRQVFHLPSLNYF